MGLEPTTVGLRVQRSTDWASRAWMIYLKSRIWVSCFRFMLKNHFIPYCTYKLWAIWRTCCDRFWEFWDKWIRFLEFDSNYCWKASILSRESSSITHFWQIYINPYIAHPFKPGQSNDPTKTVRESTLVIIGKPPDSVCSNCFLSSSAEFSSWLSWRLSVFVSGGIFFGIRINPRLWQKTRPRVKSHRQFIGQFWIISDFNWQKSNDIDMEEYILKQILKFS